MKKLSKEILARDAKRDIGAEVLEAIREIKAGGGRKFTVQVTCSDHAELSDVTLSIMGDAIVRDVEKLRDIIRDVNAQRLEPPHGTKPGVREERATYLVLPARVPMGGASYVVRQHSTYQ
jgi:hypothetical protein